MKKGNNSFRNFIIIVVVVALFWYLYTITTKTKTTTNTGNSAPVDDGEKPVSPVRIISNVMPKKGIAITFTALDVEGSVRWYKNGVLLNEALSFTVTSPTENDIYTARQVVNGVESIDSNSIKIAPADIVVTPSVSVLRITSNITPIAEQSITLTALDVTGSVRWYKDGSLISSTLSINVISAVEGDYYTARHVINGVESADSNRITIAAKVPNPPDPIEPPVNSGVTITEPNATPYFFSGGFAPSHYDNNQNAPAIFQNEPRYNPVTDLVWLKNDKIKVGINLKRGGQIAWLSELDETTNLVYNGGDGGLQAQLDPYQNPDGYTQAGQISGREMSGSPTFSYNVTQGGDFRNHAVKLIKYNQVTDGYYVKLRPIHYPMDSLLSETFIEVKYTLVGRLVKAHYKYTSYRTDNQVEINNPFGFVGWGIPACFLVNTLDKYQTFENGNVITGEIPNVTDNHIQGHQNFGKTPKVVNSSQFYGVAFNAATNKGFGFYNKSESDSGAAVPTTPVLFKQLEVYAGNPAGTEWQGGFTFVQPNITLVIPDGRNYVKESTAYLGAGSPNELAAAFNALS